MLPLVSYSNSRQEIFINLPHRGYQLWNDVVGGAVPCYSSLTNTLTPPVVPLPNVLTMTSSKRVSSESGEQITDTTSSSSYSPTDSKPTSAVVNVVYAVSYPVKSKSGISKGAKAGIGAGSGAAVLAIIVLALLLIRKYRHSKKDKQTIAALSAGAPDSTHQSQANMSTVSPYAYSNRTELPSEGIGSAQSPSSGYSGLQNGYFVPQVNGQQSENGGYYTHQPFVDEHQGQQLTPQVPIQGVQPIQRRPVPGQSQEMQYSPAVSTVSPPPGSSHQSFHTGYGGSPSSQQQQMYYVPPQQLDSQPWQVYEMPQGQHNPHELGRQ
jgi:hypothetical protein